MATTLDKKFAQMVLGGVSALISEVERLETHCESLEIQNRAMLKILKEVKAWRDDDGNHGFPHETRLALEEILRQVGFL